MSLGFEFRMRKEELRGKLLGLRDSLKPKDIAKMSLEIEKRFEGLVEYSEADTIMFYMATDNEVKTDYAIRRAFKAKKRVLLPSTDSERKTLIPNELEGINKVKKGRFGIMEPLGEEVNTDEIDIIVVPVIGFDSDCDRLGRGLGYYDGFLRDIKCLKVGFAFRCQMVENVPREDHDVRLDKIVTETRVLVRGQ